MYIDCILNSLPSVLKFCGSKSFQNMCDKINLQYVAIEIILFPTCCKCNIIFKSEYIGFFEFAFDNFVDFLKAQSFCRSAQVLFKTNFYKR